MENEFLSYGLQPRFFSKKILWIFFKLFDLMWNTGTHLVNFIEFYYTGLLKLTVWNIISPKHSGTGT